ncbi:MAG TPA: HlyD family efflux transporter periplasmic adaptor subunit [Saprospiraceae bacterium]|nr:HlyD family efflux transporter periplasmic adaptor subunit [Saprospiraceae bacterium]
MRKSYLLFLVISVFAACDQSNNNFDASGIFEADEVIVSAESMGKLISLKITEGDVIKKGAVVGGIEDNNLLLQKGQLQATIDALYDKKVSPAPQASIYSQQIINQNANIATLKAQMKVLQVEQNRISQLVSKDAVPAKQLDDINGQVSILNQRIAAAETMLGTLRQQIKSTQSTSAIQNKAILSEQKPLEQRIAQLDDQIQKSIIVNPIDGTVLTKYMEENEVATIGKPIYKIAKLDQLILRAYVTGNQLNQIKVNQKVGVTTGSDENAKTTEGTIIWVASKAEFTPKTIQTVDERSNLVYAIKVLVPNDGYLKLGMYGDVSFQNNSSDKK